MNKKQKVIARLQQMSVRDNFSYDDFEDISFSYFNKIMRELCQYVWPDSGGYGNGPGGNVPTVYTLTDNDIPMPEIKRNSPKRRNTNPIYIHRLTVMLDDKLNNKIKLLPEGKRSEFIRNIIEEALQ